MHTTEQPVTPESLAEVWTQANVTPPLRTVGYAGFLAGYQANAIRNAGIAQARDLAEAALRRHGFEPGVVQDVTWVRKREDWMVDTAARLITERDGLLKDVERLTQERDSHRDVCRSVAAKLNAVYAGDPSATLEKRARAVVEMVERLTTERDAARGECQKNYDRGIETGKMLGVQPADFKALRAELSAAREAIEIVQQCNRDMALLNDSAHAQLSAANEARAKAEKDLAAEKLTSAGWRNEWLDARKRRDDSRAAMEKERVALVEMTDKMNQAIGWYEKERAEVERLKKACAKEFDDVERLDSECNSLRRQLASHESMKELLGEEFEGYDDATEAVNDLRRQLAEAKIEHEKAYTEWLNMRFQLIEWQAVAGKIREAVEAIKSLIESVCMCRYNGKDHWEEWRALESALSTPPATALLDELERAWKEGRARLAPLSEIPADTVHRVWLASETRKRFTTASQSAQMPASVPLTAAEDASGGGSAGGAHGATQGAQQVGEVHP